MGDKTRRRNTTIIWLVGTSVLLISSSIVALRHTIDNEMGVIIANALLLQGIMYTLGNAVGVLSLTAVVHLAMRLAGKAS